ncbi:MAG TPA: hypothetical protein DHV69_02155 [Sphaerochaeta sp.]|jgi:hypothetical protein|nr:DUF1858 domain-containing protein [Sphaerochaeta sp.]PKL22585.1 MAG: hypothetical protein CVV48_02010 [Spirochaetae bacterium HGW-Spirochaetae-4]PKL28664.1 MAG: hypothetical protein CVV46_05045 [Spirochaetae bacterium HGW-Spirochaetae-2]HCG62704.1 hypothetical protein [Sphaerochaeta sp.]HCJ94040.1 hypothetical protein [Sphaerochaeta sp.]
MIRYDKESEMDKKTIDLQKTVHALCSADPELAPLLAELGFTEIVKPIMLNTVGKVMTLPKGAAMRGIALPTIIRTLESHGYTVIEAPQEEKK